MPNVSTKKRLSATVYYLLSAMVLGWPGLFASGPLLPAWRNGDISSPLSLGAIHITVLGLMLTVAFGVMYQIVPIAFQAPPIPRHVLFWHLPLHLLSVVIMVVGFVGGKWNVVGFGGTLLVVLAAVYLGRILYSFRKARNKTAVHKSLVLPFVSLWIVLLIGVYQALFPASTRESVIMTHVIVGAFAFWGALVLVFSYKLVPMFTLSHGYRASLPRTIRFYYAGLAVLVIAAWVARPAASWLEAAGVFFTVIGLCAYIKDLYSIVKARKRRRMVLPMLDAFAATLCIVAGHFWIMLALIAKEPSWFSPAAYLYGFGGLIPLMFAYMQKIVPFLWFEYRFSKRPERKTAPLIDDMVPRRSAQAAMIVYYIGIIVGLVVFAVGAPTFQTVGGWVSGSCLTLGSIILFFALRHVTTIGGRRPPDDAEQ